MTPRNRLLELAQARELAAIEAQQASATGQRNAQAAQAWGSAIQQGVQGLAGLGAGFANYQAQQADKLADSLVARSFGAVGDIEQGVVSPRAIPQAKPLSPTVLPVEPRKPGPWAASEQPPVANPWASYSAPAAKPTPDTGEARPIIGGPSNDPSVATRYAKTPGQLAADAVAGDKSLVDDPNPVMRLFGGDRSRARADAEARIAKDVYGQRTTQDTNRRELLKYQQELQLKLAKIRQDDDHFDRGQAWDKEKTAGGQTFSATEAAKGRGFTSGQNALNRTQTVSEGALNRSSAERRANAIATGQATKAERVPDTVRNSLGELGASYTLASEVTKKVAALDAAGVSRGRGASTLNGVAQELNLDTPEYTAVKADLKDLRGQYKVALTGAGCSDKEAEEILETMPNERDQGSFGAKMAAFQRRVEIKISSKLDVYEADGFNVGGLRSYVSSLGKGSPTPSESAATSSGKPSAEARTRQLLAEDPSLSDDDLLNALRTEGY